jgi:tryptophanyl-tRNA synthetase
MIELTNEVVEKFNRIYGDTFQKVKAISADKNSAEARLPGIDGSAKMGKSLNNAIYLSDTEEVVQEKIMNMYTDPDHVHVEDPGRVGGNVVFTYLDVFDQDKESLANLKEKYKAGGLGDVEIKKRLIKVINDFLDPIRERREHLSTKPDFIKDVVKEGEEVARRVVQATYKEVTEAMGINYY